MHVDYSYICMIMKLIMRLALALAPARAPHGCSRWQKKKIGVPTAAGLRIRTNTRTRTRVRVAIAFHDQTMYNS
jgi:hypothetical protein